MNFTEEKQAEFEAFAAYYAIIAQKPYTAATRSLLNNLRTIAVGQYGNGAWQQLVRDNRRQPAEQPERVVKTSGGSQRRNAPPQQGNAPQPGTPRWERLKAAGLLEGKSAAHEVVAGGEYDAKQFYEAGGGNILMDARKAERQKAFAGAFVKNSEVEPEKKERQRTRKEIIEQVSADYKKEIETQIWERETPIVHLSTGDEFDTETGRTVNDLMADAAIKGVGELSGKELLEKYSRDLIFEKLLELGHSLNELEEKSDRQLANLLKKEASK